MLDVAGLLVLPGLVDAHTHLREPGQSHKEGIDRGSHAALAGGVTTLLDMPNDVPPTDSAERLEAKARLYAARCRVHWGLHVLAPLEGPPPSRPYAAAKLYLAKSSARAAVTDEASLAAAFAAHRIVAVHAEDETRFSRAPPGIRAHHVQRPREAVVSALARVERVLTALPQARRPRVVLCHAATIQDVEWLRRMKSQDFDVWGETCPHYLFFTEDDYVREGPRLKVNPPLRSAEDRQALLAALRDGTLDFVSSDHAPHSPEEKADEAQAPSGIPGIERMAPALLELVERGVLGWDRWLAVGSARAAACYGLAGRDGIRDGGAGDLVLVERGGGSQPAVVTGAGYDAYSAIDFAWRVRATFVGGRLAWRDGALSQGLPQEVYA